MSLPLIEVCKQKGETNAGKSAITILVATWASNASFMYDFDDYADADDYDCGGDDSENGYF